MNKILIVVDMQNDFIEGALGTKEAVSVLKAVTEKIRSFQGKIFVTMDTHQQNYLETKEGKELPVEHCIKGTEGWELHSRVQEALKDKEYTVLEKPSFGSLQLAEELAGCMTADTKIELIGLCTDICVVSNALLLRANFPEADIAVLADCCAGVTPEAHRAALLTMKSCQIDVIGE